MTPNQRKAIAAAAIAIAAPAEGLRQVAYRDPVGILTVCEGHTGPDIVAGRTYTLEQCKALLESDMLGAVDAVERCQPGLPESVHIAFADAVFNIGPTIACDTKKSTAARMLAAKDYRGACLQLPKWDKVHAFGVTTSLPGLTKRRAKEMETCLMGAV